MSTGLVHYGRAVATLLLVVTAGHSIRGTSAIAPAHSHVTPARRPIAFEPANASVISGIQFIARTSGTTLALTRNGATLRSNQASFELRVVGGNPSAPLAGIEPDRAMSHYLIGNDRMKWRTNVPHYRKVKYEGVYSGIDLVFYGAGDDLEYDFVVAPGADPGRIALELRGTDALVIDRDGNLRARSPEGPIVQRRPMIYQQIDGRRQTVAGGYVLRGAHTLAFDVGAHDLSHALTIDPVLMYGTYLGGANNDQINGTAVGADGSVYVAGYTASTNFPTLSPYQGSLHGIAADAFVSKFDANGALIYSTYLGGASKACLTCSTPFNMANAVAVDPAGNIYLAGETSAGDFPLTANAIDTVGDTNEDAFVTKLDATGSALVFSTLAGGGNGADRAWGVAADANGSTYVAGMSGSTGLPTTANAFRTTKPSVFASGFAMKFDASGGLEYSSYFGANKDPGETFDETQAFAVATDGAGHIYVAGTSTTSGLPTTAGALQTSLAGARDAFVAEFDPFASGAASLVFSTFLGGTATGFGASGEDSARGIAVDGDGAVYVSGVTGSGDFPATTVVGDRTYDDLFVAKLNATGTAVVYSVVVGDDQSQPIFQSAKSVALDDSKNAFAAGTWIPNGGGSQDAVLVAITNDGAFSSASLIGGSSREEGAGVGVDPDGNVWVGGSTYAIGLNPANGDDFPVTLAALQHVYGGGFVDAFLVKVGDLNMPRNHPPVANAGDDRSVECTEAAGTTVTLDGSASSDADKDALTFTWTEGETTLAATGDPTTTADVTLGCGAHTITLTVADGRGGVSQDTATITVVDTTPPTIASAAATPSVLSPPNHKMRSATVTVAVTDVCDSTPSCQITSVTSTEPITGGGDGDTSPDWIITGPLTLDLRAERGGSGPGRTYSITVRCTDAHGNAATKIVTVKVPH